MWPEAFLAKVEESMLFPVACEEGRDNACIELIDCVGQCNWPMLVMWVGLSFLCRRMVLPCFQ